MSILKRAIPNTTNDTIYVYELTNSNNMCAKVTNYGAILVSLLVPNKNNELSDVVLGYDNIEKYYKNLSCFGSTIGRNANRIYQGKFDIDGTTYNLEINDTVNNLHSGNNGYNKRIWDSECDEANNSVTFHLFSEDGDQGFPGNLNVYVTYMLSEDNELKIIYKGKSDKKTVFNLTNHSYFNLSGHDSGTINDHLLWIDAKEFTPIGKDTFVPTGDTVSVKGTPMDFTSFKKIGQDIDADYEQLLIAKGYDHNYVLDNPNGDIKKIAVVKEESSGRTMQVFTDCPGVQLYTSNTTSDLGKNNAQYGNRCGVCLETQFFPNAINEPMFRQPVIEPNKEYSSTTIYKFV